MQPNHEEQQRAPSTAEAIVEYIDRLNAEGLSDRTVQVYTGHLRRFLRWCGLHNVDPVDLSATELRRFSATVKLTRSSRAQARSSLRRWFEANRRHDNVWDSIRVPSKPKMQSRALPDEDIRKIVHAASLIGGHKGLAVMLCVYTAARRSEVAVMRWDGWDRKREILAFERSKTGDVHTVPVHPVLAHHLELGWESASSYYMFPGNVGRSHVTPTTIWKWVCQVGEMAGLSVSPHLLRHTALTVALEATRDLRAVQELAGHRDPMTTAGYTRVSARRVADAVSALDYLATPADDDAPPLLASDQRRRRGQPRRGT